MIVSGSKRQAKRRYKAHALDPCHKGLKKRVGREVGGNGGVSVHELEALRALEKTDGNVSRASKLLKVNTRKLYALINSSSELKLALLKIREAEIEEKLDKAETVIDALMDSCAKTPREALKAATFLLTQLGKGRGYSNTGVSVNTLNLQQLVQEISGLDQSSKQEQVEDIEA
jgi:hypothetical protein